MLLVILCGLVAMAASALLTSLVIVFARRSEMLDAPGARRMHQRPTVRGAGLGFVLVIVAAWASLGLMLGWSSALGRWALLSSGAIVAVATISWFDDLAPLPVWPRLLTHLIAAFLVAASVLCSGQHWALALVAFAAIPVLINFWNFIDGINGIAAAVGALVMVGVCMLALIADDVPAAVFAVIGASAVLAFLPFNFPRARAFMGDVGSASLGLTIGALALLPINDRAPPLWELAALSSAVVLDAGLTLLWRMSRRPRRRWYNAHREHTYQWLARSGWGHTRTTLAYLLWTAGPALGVVILGQIRPDLMPIATLSLYLVGAATWRIARDHALRRRRASA